jgi:hypothetical protein
MGTMGETGVVSRAALSSCGWWRWRRGDVDGSPPYDRMPVGPAGPGCPCTTGHGRGLVAGALVVGCAESFFQDWCVWSAFVGYEGARRQATFGEDEVDTFVNAQKGICFWCSHFEEGRNRIE